MTTVSLVGPSDAWAQLRAEHVLVVYDSRIASSRSVAEYYAGSANVPGGTGTEPGVQPGVSTLDLATTGADSVEDSDGTIAHVRYVERLRDPIRQALRTRGLADRIRCLVLCKGLPHRVQDTDNSAAGDSPNSVLADYIEGDATAASVDSRLCLLWTDLRDEDEAGGTNDSLLDGIIRNPMWRTSRSVVSYSNRFRESPKAFFNDTALSWGTSSSAGSASFTPGDMLLVTRLDGRTVADVKAMIDRAQGIVWPADVAAVVIDESNSNGVADSFGNGEFDNVLGITRGGDDLEQTRDAVLADGRLDSENVVYDALAGADNFLIGTELAFESGGKVVDRFPVIVLGHYAGNHDGQATMPEAGNGKSGKLVAETFIYAPGAVFHTIESYNARDFGGIGTRFGQEQVSDFIGAGGTFGVGSVFEPLADHLPDLDPIVRNFTLGGLTWVEAAYTGIPTLDWMSLVVGDPLARAHFDRDDVDGDGAVTMEDLYAWHAAPTDVNRDGSIDGDDVRLIELRVRQGAQATGEFNRDG